MSSLQCIIIVILIANRNVSPSVHEPKNLYGAQYRIVVLIRYGSTLFWPKVSRAKRRQKMLHNAYSIVPVCLVSVEN